MKCKLSRLSLQYFLLFYFISITFFSFLKQIQLIKHEIYQNISISKIKYCRLINQERNKSDFIEPAVVSAFFTQILYKQDLYFLWTKTFCLCDKQMGKIQKMFTWGRYKAWAAGCVVEGLACEACRGGELPIVYNKIKNMFLWKVDFTNGLFSSSTLTVQVGILRPLNDCEVNTRNANILGTLFYFFIINTLSVHRPVETNEFLPIPCFLNRNMQLERIYYIPWMYSSFLTETIGRTLARFTRLLWLGLVFNHSFRLLALLVEGNIFFPPFYYPRRRTGVDLFTRPPIIKLLRPLRRSEASN